MSIEVGFKCKFMWKHFKVKLSFSLNITEISYLF